MNGGTMWAYRIIASWRGDWWLYCSI